MRTYVSVKSVKGQVNRGYHIQICLRGLTRNRCSPADKKHRTNILNIAKIINLGFMTLITRFHILQEKRDNLQVIGAF